MSLTFTRDLEQVKSQRDLFQQENEGFSSREHALSTAVANAERQIASICMLL